MRVCVDMTTTPGNGTLAREVVVSLSTVDGTGMYAEVKFPPTLINKGIML